MLGAIIGDIAGSVYEFEPTKTKDFDLFQAGCSVTDDSVMTVAVAEALIALCGDESDEEIKKMLVKSMKKWGRRYPDAGYGGRFGGWLYFDDPEPYNSFGNGSAMRVSPAGWLYPNMEKTRHMARLTAEVTHNHPEGIKGAESVAVAIYMSRKGATKEEIREYIEIEFGYDLGRTCDEIRPDYAFDVTCQGSVPEAIICFLDGDSYEDTIRNAISLGGDADTQAAIAGSIAEAYYMDKEKGSLGDQLKKEAREHVPEDMLKVVNSFYDKVRDKLDEEKAKAMERFMSNGDGVEIVKGKKQMEETAKKIMQRYYELKKKK